MTNYNVHLLKPGSQYDARASVASRASGWRWNRIDFYSSIASWALASVQPIRLSKNLMSGMQFDWWKKERSWRSRRQCHIVNQALRPLHTRPKKRIQCASNAHSLCLHLNPVWGNVHWMRIESIHLWRWIGSELKPNSLFIHQITIKSRTVTPLWTATFALEATTHAVFAVQDMNYDGLSWPIMLGRYWLDAVDKETAYQVVSCSLSKFTFHVVYYQWQGKANNWTDISVCFDTSRMLAWETKSRNHYLGCSGCGMQQQFSYNSVSKFW